MDIELSSIILSIIMLSFFAIPIMYDQWSKKKGSKNIKKKFLGTAKNYDISITQHDVWDNTYFIGVDPASGKLLYLSDQNGTSEEVLINLAEVKKCRISNKSVSIKRPGKKNLVTDKVELVCSFKNSKKSDQALELYRSDKNGDLTAVRPMAKKWVEIINSNLA